MIFQLRKKDMAIYFTIYGIYGEMNLKEPSCNLFFGQKVYEKKRNRMQVFCKKKKPIIIYMCMYVCHIQLIYKFIVVWFLKLS